MSGFKKSATGIFAASILLTVVAGMCSGSIAQTYAAPNDHLIVPGERVGPFVLGMTEDDLLKVMRPSNRRAAFLSPPGGNTSSPATLYCYVDENVCAFVDQSNSRVVRLQVGFDGQCSSYRTADGITCGVTYENISQSFGLGTPDVSLSSYNMTNHGLEQLGFRNDTKGTKTLIIFYDMDTYREDQEPLNTCRGFIIAYKQYG